jgi:hypothetical protein
MNKYSKNALQAFSPARLSGGAIKRRLFKKFADEHDLVYFGTVNRQDDEYRLVKGVTVSTTHRDDHYCVGSFAGRDLILLERHDTLRLPHAKKGELFTWTILQVDLRPPAPLPHGFLDGHHHGATFYHAAFAKLSRLTALSEHYFATYDPLFVQTFTAYSSLETSAGFTQLVSPGTAAVLAHHFTAFDFEWRDDALLVYLYTKKPAVEQLEYMLKAGVWFANELESVTI